MTGDGAPGTPKVVRGSMVTHRRKCGKVTCRCADGEQLHESTVLSYREGGRTRFLMLPAQDVAAVQAATARYRAALAKIEADGEAGRATLINRLKR